MLAPKTFELPIVILRESKVIRLGVTRKYHEPVSPWHQSSVSAARTAGGYRFLD